MRRSARRRLAKDKRDKRRAEFDELISDLDGLADRLRESRFNARLRCLVNGHQPYVDVDGTFCLCCADDLTKTLDTPGG